jgi:hypothetical protein
MSGRPMATSVGLAVYFAERNHGVFKNKFMTFSSKPSFVELKGNSLYERLRCIPAIVENTDLEKAFKLILKTAVNNSIPQEDMPKSLVVISDMQFDDCQSYYGEAMNMTWHENMKKVYEDMGYELPNIIYWNVDRRRDSFQVTTGMAGVQLASGQSPSTFKTIIKNIGCTPYEAMMNTLNSPEYDCITV